MAPRANGPAPACILRLHAMSSPDSPLAIEQLLAHEAWMRRLAQRLIADPHTADDLLQRTWMAALRSPPRKASRSWLAGVFKNFARQHRRSEATRRRHEDFVGEREREESPDRLAERMDLQRRLAELLLGLEEPYRSTLLLRFYGENSSAQIGRRMQVPEGTVRWRLKRGLELLREALDRQHAGQRSRWFTALAGFYGTPSDAPVAASTGGLGVTTVATMVLGLGVLGVAGWLLLSEREWMPTASSTLTRAEQSQSPQPRAPDATLAELEQPAVGRVPLTSLLEQAPSPGEADGQAARLSAGDRIRLRAVGADGQPVEGASVRVLVASNRYEERARTDSEGLAQLECRPEDFDGHGFPHAEGKVGVRLFAPGCGPSGLHHFSREAFEQGPISIALGAGGPTLRGRIVDDSWRPIAGALVSAVRDGNRARKFKAPWHLTTEAPHSAISNEAGSVEFENVGAWPHNLLVRAPGFVTQRQVELPSEQREHAFTVRLKAGAILTGSVRNSEGRLSEGAELWFDPLLFGNPFSDRQEPGYIERLYGYSQRVLTDSRGQFRLDGIPTGEVRVWAQHPGSPEETAQHVFLARGGSRETWDAVLQPRAPFEVSVHDHTGEPVVGHLVAMESVKGRGPTWLRLENTDQAGRARLFDVPDLPFKLMVTKPYMVDAALETRTGCTMELSPLEIVLMAPRLQGHFTGRLLAHDGRSLGTGSLLYHELDRRELSQQSVNPRDGSIGRAMDPGRYWIDARFPSVGVLSLGERRLEPGAVLDLGTTHARKPGTIRMEGEWAREEGLRFELFALHGPAEQPTRRVPIDEGVESPARMYRVLPGRYGFEVFYEDERVSHLKAELDAGGEVRFDMRPAAWPIVTFRIERADAGKAEGVARLQIEGEGGERVHDSSRELIGDSAVVHVQLAPARYRVEVELDDGTHTSLERLEVQESGVLRTVRLRVE